MELLNVRVQHFSVTLEAVGPCQCASKGDVNDAGCVLCD